MGLRMTNLRDERSLEEGGTKTSGVGSLDGVSRHRPFLANHRNPSRLCIVAVGKQVLVFEGRCGRTYSDLDRSNGLAGMEGTRAICDGILVRSDIRFGSVDERIRGRFQKEKSVFFWTGETPDDPTFLSIQQDR